MPFKDPEKRKLYKHQYHQEHKQEINQRHNERRQTKEYKEQRKQYILANKDKLDARNKERFACECSGCYTRHNKSTHEKSNMHIEWMQLKKFNQTE